MNQPDQSSAPPPQPDAVGPALSPQSESISDVMIILDPKAEGHMDQVVADLKHAGLIIADINRDEGMVEGTIDAYNVGHLRSLHDVDYVRTIFTYTAYVPPGNGRHASTPSPGTPEEGRGGGFTQTAQPQPLTTPPPPGSNA